MLEQYNKNISSNSHDALSESGFQMSQRKLVFTLAGAALILLLFLFLVGTFKSDETNVEKNLATPLPTAATDARLKEIESRLEKLEKQNTASNMAPETVISTEPAFDPQMFEETPAPVSQSNIIALSDEALKQLIATNPVQSTPDHNASTPPAPRRWL